MMFARVLIDQADCATQTFVFIASRSICHLRCCSRALNVVATGHLVEALPSSSKSGTSDDARAVKLLHRLVAQPSEYVAARVLESVEHLHCEDNRDFTEQLFHPRNEREEKMWERLAELLVVVAPRGSSNVICHLLQLLLNDEDRVRDLACAVLPQVVVVGCQEEAQLVSLLPRTIQEVFIGVLAGPVQGESLANSLQTDSLLIRTSYRCGLTCLGHIRPKGDQRALDVFLSILPCLREESLINSVLRGLSYNIVNGDIRTFSALIDWLAKPAVANEFSFRLNSWASNAISMEVLKDLFRRLVVVDERKYLEGLLRLLGRPVEMKAREAAIAIFPAVYRQGNAIVLEALLAVARGTVHVGNKRAPVDSIRAFLMPRDIITWDACARSMRFRFCPKVSVDLATVMSSVAERGDRRVLLCLLSMLDRVADEQDHGVSSSGPSILSAIVNVSEAHESSSVRAVVRYVEKQSGKRYLLESGVDALIALLGVRVDTMVHHEHIRAAGNVAAPLGIRASCWWRQAVRVLSSCLDEARESLCSRILAALTSLRFMDLHVFDYVSDILYHIPEMRRRDFDSPQDGEGDHDSNFDIVNANAVLSGVVSVLTVAQPPPSGDPLLYRLKVLLR
eukprot:TRINITY_DN8834_c0_g1_i2.p1 TRINITY_DN8834_c0_g1~~TRINITY_DN8834_c0_g1_i2.p1  ORF type:complete len:622 (+),score=41.28 TRINITY_DN8834_c0_g1_i2:98-1963(+)